LQQGVCELGRRRRTARAGRPRRSGTPGSAAGTASASASAATRPPARPCCRGSGPAARSACTGCSAPPARLYRLFRTTCALVQAVQDHLRACTGCSGPPARLYRLFRTTCALVQAVQDHLRARAAVPLARGSTALYIYGDNAARSDGMGGSAWRARSSRAHVTAACCQHADARPTRCKDAEQNTSVMQSERRPSGSATMAIREHASPCMLEMLPHDRV